MKASFALALMILLAGANASANGTFEVQKELNPKLDPVLSFMLAEAKETGKDPSTIQVAALVGLKTNPTEAKVRALFAKHRLSVGAIIPGEGGAIVTARGPLSGFVSLSNERSVKAIEGARRHRPAHE